MTFLIEELAGRNDHEPRRAQAFPDPVRPVAAAEIPGVAAPGLSRAAEGKEPHRAVHRPRRGDRPLVQVRERPRHLGLGRAEGRRRHRRLQERGARRRPADAADQLARPDQRAEGIPAHRRGRRRPRQLVRPDRDDVPDRRPEVRHADAGRLDALLQHDQRRPGVRLCQGRQDRPHDADRSRRRRRRLVHHRGEGPEAHAAAQDHARAARPERQVDRLFAGPAALSDEARRLRSEGRAQSAEPRQVRLRPHLLGRGDHARHRRDQAAEVRIRPGLHRHLARLAPHLGQHRLLPLGAVSFLQRDRHDARPPQSRFMGGLVLGRGASLGPHAARRPVGDLRHRRGLPAELRHDRVVGGRSGDHLGLLRRAGRHRAPAVAEEPQARHQGRPRRSRTTTPPRSSCRASGSRRSRPRRRRWRWRSPMSGSRKVSTTRNT